MRLLKTEENKVNVSWQLISEMPENQPPPRICWMLCSVGSGGVIYFLPSNQSNAGDSSIGGFTRGPSFLLYQNAEFGAGFPVKRTVKSFHLAFYACMFSRGEHFPDIEGQTRLDSW